MKFEIIPTLTVLCLLPILIALGFWQLDRADQKRAFLAQQRQAMAAPAIQLTEDTPKDPESLRFKQAKAAGRYDSAHQILIDNRVLDGKPGFFVLTPFILNTGRQAVLVNRGWVPADQSRKSMPDITIKSAPAEVGGRINRFPSVGIKLEGADQPTEGWPAVVQVADSRILSERLGYSVFPFMLELDGKEPEGYRREWQDVAVMPPERHVGYAVQWFGLAAALVLLFLWYSRLK